MTAKRDRLHRILRGEEQYAEGPPAEQARLYRHEVLLPESVRRIREMVAENPLEPVDLLVSLSGFSPETTVCAAAFLRPKELLVLVSHTARSGLNVIKRHVDLPESHIDTRRVDPLDPVQIYRYIQDEVDQFKRFNNAKRPRVVIDITGGKKSMSAGAALAAAQLDSEMCYVDGEYDSLLRQAEPGTERLEFIRNPTKLFGDKQMSSAMLELAHGNFAAAERSFDAIAESAPIPARARFGQSLSALYAAWSDLDQSRLQLAVPEMRRRLDDGAYQCDLDLKKRIHRQLDFLDELGEDAEGEALLLNFYLLGKNYEEHDRREFAALLYYRTLEALFAKRLSDKGFSCSAPDWSILVEDHQRFFEKFAALCEQVYGTRPEALPSDVGMMSAAMVLQVIGDPFIRRFGLNSPSALSHLRSLSSSRNQSILAHGTKPVSKELCEKLENFALRGIQQYWNLAHEGENVDHLVAELRFVDGL